MCSTSTVVVGAQTQVAVSPESIETARFMRVRTATLPTPHAFTYDGVHVMHAEAPSSHGVVVRRQHLTSIPEGKVGNALDSAPPPTL